MSTAAHGSSKARRDQIPKVETKVSVYDRVSGMLVALVVLAGLIALALFMLWLTRVITIKPTPSESFLIDDLKAGGEQAEGVARDFEDPGVEELADVQEPQLADAMEAVTQAASSVQASVQAIDGNAALMGTGTGLGDSRGLGQGGDGNADALAPHERWELNYSTSSVRAYAAQLDFFEIELGAVHPSKSDITYVKGLSKTKPDSHTGYRDEEKRTYFMHSSKTLRDFDRQLLEKARSGITKGRLLVQFYPPALYKKLLDLEGRKKGNRPWESIKRTVFEVKGSGNSFEFEVTRQEFF
jgi:hypothetical protein